MRCPSGPLFRRWNSRLLRKYSSANINLPSGVERGDTRLCRIRHNGLSTVLGNHFAVRHSSAGGINRQGQRPGALGIPQPPLRAPARCQVPGGGRGAAAAQSENGRHQRGRGNPGVARTLTLSDVASIRGPLCVTPAIATWNFGGSLTFGVGNPVQVPLDHADGFAHFRFSNGQAGRWVSLPATRSAMVMRWRTVP